MSEQTKNTDPLQDEWGEIVVSGAGREDHLAVWSDDAAVVLTLDRALWDGGCLLTWELTPDQALTLGGAFSSAANHIWDRQRTQETSCTD